MHPYPQLDPIWGRYGRAYMALRGISERAYMEYGFRYYLLYYLIHFFPLNPNLFEFLDLDQYFSSKRRFCYLLLLAGMTNRLPVNLTVFCSIY